MRKLTWVVLLLGVVLLVPTASVATDVLAGVDLLVTVPSLTYQEFNGPFTIPADFFSPGSDPFTGVVALGGVPLGHSPFCPPVDLGPTDTIVRRLQDASLPNVGSQETIPIELVQLQLVSINPITVTYNGGLNPEFWDLDVTISPTVPSMGTMTITHSHANGGTFDSQLRVYPLLTFTRVSDNLQKVIDGGQVGLFDQFVANGVDWRHDSNDLVCPDCGSNFLAGTDGSQVAQWTEAAQWAAHGVQLPCTPSVPVESKTWGALKALFIR